MEQLPFEIQKILISFMDNNTKLSFRGTSTKWFKYIDHRNFTLFFTRATDLPAIFARLSQYDAPISLSFKKNFYLERDVIEHVTKLTTLTGLDLPFFRGYQRNSYMVPTFLLLSALTTLQRLTHDQPKGGQFYKLNEICRNFQHLTTLTIGPERLHFGSNKQDFEAVAPVISNNTDLVDLTLHLASPTINQQFVDVFAQHAKLTRLELLLDSVGYEPHVLSGAFKALKELVIKAPKEHSNPTNNALLDQWTTLESLKLNSQSPIVNISKLGNLTRLELTNSISFREEWSQMFRALSALTKLKHVSLSLNEVSPLDYEFLRNLTALEELQIHRDEHQTDKAILEHVTSTRLKKLIIDSQSPIRLEGIEFPMLKDASISIRQEVPNATLEKLFVSAHLTSLHFSPVNGTGLELKVLEKLSNLRGLWFEHDEINAPEKLNIRQLSNLHSLGVRAIVDPDDLQYCPRLTALDCMLDQAPGKDYKYLASLPLKCLHFHHPINDEQLWHAIGQITSLENLILDSIVDEDIVRLHKLSNLTKLDIVNSYSSFDGQTLSTLSSLQCVNTDVRQVHNRAIEPELPYWYDTSLPTHTKYFDKFRYPSENKRF